MNTVKINPYCCCKCSNKCSCNHDKCHKSCVHNPKGLREDYLKNQWLCAFIGSQINRSFEYHDDVAIYYNITIAILNFNQKKFNMSTEEIGNINRNMAILIAFGSFDKDLITLYLDIFNSFDMVSKCIKANKIHILPIYNEKLSNILQLT